MTAVKLIRKHAGYDPDDRCVPSELSKSAKSIESRVPRKSSKLEKLIVICSKVIVVAGITVFLIIFLPITLILGVAVAVKSIGRDIVKCRESKAPSTGEAEKNNITVDGLELPVSPTVRDDLSDADHISDVEVAALTAEVEASTAKRAKELRGCEQSWKEKCASKQASYDAALRIAKSILCNHLRYLIITVQEIFYDECIPLTLSDTVDNIKDVEGIINDVRTSMDLAVKCGCKVDYKDTRALACLKEKKSVILRENLHFAKSLKEIADSAGLFGGRYDGSARSSKYIAYTMLEPAGKRIREFEAFIKNELKCSEPRSVVDNTNGAENVYEDEKNVKR